ncbi:ABC transporter permease subunit [Clostridium frigoris]|uniref:ABC transporter permease subunit n=1 Tax=Clostridium frigoris TaxID=205327 RepID=A0ABS6BSZ6_9CLOT|nr:ABC-2 transporter permease [Clostridium frigoris]MBU3160036.1 ABC transporter permease subunit [Clostridium frigoris]
MSKGINKALVYKEWINVRWVTLLTIIILFYAKVDGVITELNHNKTSMRLNGTVWTDRWFNNGLYVKDVYLYLMLFLVILLAITLFLGEKTSETGGFIASMPFTRKEIILNKWFVGVVSLLISFVVTFIILSLIYLANINDLDIALNPYSDIVKWFFMDTFQYISIFTFMMFAQSIMGNCIVSSIVGGVVLVVPLFLNSLALKYQAIQSTRLFSSKVTKWLCIYMYNITQQNWVNTESNSGKEMYRTFYYTNYKSKLLIFFVLTCLFLYLAYVSYKKRNLEYNLRLIVFKNLEPVFIIIISICLGILGGSIFAGESINSFGIWFVVFTIIGYFIFKVLLNVLSKRK